MPCGLYQTQSPEISISFFSGKTRKCTLLNNETKVQQPDINNSPLPVVIADLLDGGFFFSNTCIFVGYCVSSNATVVGKKVAIKDR